MQRAKELAQFGVEPTVDLDLIDAAQFEAMLAEARGEFEAAGQRAQVEESEKELAAQRRFALATDFTRYFNASHPLPAERGPKCYCYGLPMEQYRDFPGVNASLLSEITPAEMLHSLTTPEDDKMTEAKTVGVLLHWAVLEPWIFDHGHRHEHMEMCVTKGVDTKAADAQRKECPGKLLVTLELLELAYRCRDAIALHAEASAMLSRKDLAKEVSGFVFDGKNNVWRKVRYDLFPLNASWIGDVKTTRKHPSQFEKDVWEYSYHCQAAWYLDTHFQLTGEFREVFKWLVVNKEPPFMCKIFDFVNRKPSDPLYQKNKLQMARERLGLDDSPRLARLPLFISAAQQTIAHAEAGAQLTPALLRRVWEAYENEQEPAEIL